MERGAESGRIQHGNCSPRMWEGDPWGMGGSGLVVGTRILRCPMLYALLGDGWVMAGEWVDLKLGLFLVLCCVVSSVGLSIS